MARSVPWGERLNEALRFTGSSSSIPVVALGALALGGGARLVKNLVDLYRRPPTETEAGIGKLSPDIAHIPVEVTDDEAEELRRRGINVPHMMEKMGQDYESPWADTYPTFTGGLVTGGVGTLALMGGWKAVDYLIDRARKKAIKEDISRVRGRIRSILDDRPESRDIPAHAFMKAAEDIYFNYLDKNAEPGTVKLAGMEKVAFLPGWLKAVGGGLIGSGAVLAALKGYRSIRSGSPVSSKLKAIKDAVRKRLRRTPVARLAPYRVSRLDLEKEREKSYDELAEVIKRRGATPVQRASVGSPADQAAANEYEEIAEEIPEEEEEEEEFVEVPEVAAAEPSPVSASAGAFY